MAFIIENVINNAILMRLDQIKSTGFPWSPLKKLDQRTNFNDPGISGTILFLVSLLTILLTMISLYLKYNNLRKYHFSQF